MKRSKSFDSLFSMSQFPCPNSPYEIFTQPSSPFDSFHDPSYCDELPDGAQPFNPAFHEPAEISDSYSSNDSVEEPPAVQTADNVQDIVFTNTCELRSVLATLSHFNNGQLGQHLQGCKGLLMLPLECVTALRTPNGHHCRSYPCIVFFPHFDLSHYTDTLPNLVEGINVIYGDFCPSPPPQPQ